MAIGVGITTKVANTTGTTAVTPATGINTTSGSTVVVALHWRSSANFTSLQDNKGNTYVQIGTQLTHYSVSRLYHCENINGGTDHQWTLTLSGSTEKTVLVLEVTGAATSGSLDQSAVDDSVAEPWYSGQTAQTTYATELAVAFCAGGGGNPEVWSIDATSSVPTSGNWTERIKEVDGTNYWVGSMWTAPITSLVQANVGFNMANSNTPDAAGIYIATFKEALGPITFDLTGARTVASIGHATLVGDLDAFARYWRAPSNAAQGTPGRMIVYTAGSPVTAVAYEGAVTADASGYFNLPTSDLSSPGTKRFAMVHAWNGVTGTTSIYGGPGISELIQVG